MVVFGLQHDRRALGQPGHGDCHLNGSGMLVVHELTGPSGFQIVKGLDDDRVHRAPTDQRLMGDPLAQVCRKAEKHRPELSSDIRYSLNERSTVLYHVELAKRNSTVLQFSMARTDPQTNIRLPFGLKERLGAAARANTRTLSAEIVQRLEASFSSTDELLFVIKKNTAEADMIWELRDSMQSLQAEVAELRTNLTKVIGDEADPEMAGVPDFTDEKGMAILQTRRIVGELLESVKALTKSPSPGDRNSTN